MIDDLEQIGAEVQRQLHEAKNADPEQQRLEDELARIPYNPEFSDPERPDKEVTAFGQHRKIYQVNNFPIVLTVVNDLLDLRPPRDIFAQALGNAAEERHYKAIFAQLRNEFPMLYKRALEVQAAEAQRGKQLEPATDEQMYILSQAFAAAATLARQLDPSYDLARLRG